MLHGFPGVGEYGCMCADSDIKCLVSAEEQSEVEMKPQTVYSAGSEAL